jgi:hypothetical protein
MPQGGIALAHNRQHGLLMYEIERGRVAEDRLHDVGREHG